MKIQRSDFKNEFAGDVAYLSWKGKNCEICIETGWGCLDIAVYNFEKEILEPKVTINTFLVNRLGICEFFKKIDKVVNDFYKKWEIKK